MALRLASERTDRRADAQTRRRMESGVEGRCDLGIDNFIPKGKEGVRFGGTRDVVLGLPPYGVIAFVACECTDLCYFVLYGGSRFI